MFVQQLMKRQSGLEKVLGTKKTMDQQLSQSSQASQAGSSPAPSVRSAPASPSASRATSLSSSSTSMSSSSSKASRARPSSSASRASAVAWDGSTMEDHSSEMADGRLPRIDTMHLHSVTLWLTRIQHSMSITDADHQLTRGISDHR